MGETEKEKGKSNTQNMLYNDEDADDHRND